jgi:hypothetical protein
MIVLGDCWHCENDCFGRFFALEFKLVFDCFGDCFLKGNSVFIFLGLGQQGHHGRGPPGKNFARPARGSPAPPGKFGLPRQGLGTVGTVTRKGQVVLIPGMNVPNGRSVRSVR